MTGALLLGMTWVWIVCLILLVGAELNEILADRAGVISENSSTLARLARARTHPRAASRRLEPAGVNQHALQERLCPGFRRRFEDL